MTCHVTHHAVECFIERINPTLTFEQARARIIASSKAIEVAAAFGCNVVRTGDGAKLVLVGERVVNVVHRCVLVRPTTEADLL
jgi:hypothetical protein